MAQHDMNIANQGFPAFRSDLNNALAALVSTSSGDTEPSTTFAHQMWVDTAANPSILKIRNADNDAWITIGTINQTADTFKLTPAGGISTDTIAELTSAAGVTIDGVLLKDGLVNTLTVGQGAGSVSTNTAVGASALAANTTGANNTAVGANALDANTTGVQNTAVGVDALGANVSGNNNTAVGYNALLVNTGNANTAIGHNSGLANTTGGDNTALGLQALKDNTTGSSNTALGVQALVANTTASFNTAVGRYALGANTTGANNTAVGYQALDANTTGTVNTAVGSQALGANTTGIENTAFGYQALDANTTGNSNVAMGVGSLGANTTGASNTAVGYEAGVSITTGSGNVCIGYLAGKGQISTASNNLFIARSNTGAGNAATWILGDGNGACIQGNNSSSWTTVSDGRLKNVLGDFDRGLNAINQLSVKKFKYKTKEEMPDLVKNEFGIATFEPDPTIEYVGVIAQELQSIIPEAVKQNDKGILQVDSDAVFWSAIKAIKELSAQVTALQAEVNTLKGQ